MDLGLQVLIPLSMLSSLLQPSRLLGGRMGERGDDFSLPRWGGTPCVLPGGTRRGDHPEVCPRIPGPRELGLSGSRLARGLCSHGQVEQNPEQLPARTRCSGIKVPLCRNN